MNTVLITSGVLLLAACASTPPAPTAALDAAGQAIAAAEREDAGRHAAGDLGEARARLTAANAAAGRERMIEAERLAAEARVAAELASARTATVKAVAVNEEMKRSTRVLTEEMERRSGANAGGLR